MEINNREVEEVRGLRDIVVGEIKDLRMVMDNGNLTDEEAFNLKLDLIILEVHLGELEWYLEKVGEVEKVLLWDILLSKLMGYKKLVTLTETTLEQVGEGDLEGWQVAVGAFEQVQASRDILLWLMGDSFGEIDKI